MNSTLLARKKPAETRRRVRMSFPFHSRRSSPTAGATKVEHRAGAENPELTVGQSVPESDPLRFSGLKNKRPFTQFTLLGQPAKQGDIRQFNGAGRSNQFCVAHRAQSARSAGFSGRLLHRSGPRKVPTAKAALPHVPRTQISCIVLIRGLMKRLIPFAIVLL